MPTGSLISQAQPLRVLIIEDYEEDAVLLRRHLVRAGCNVEARRVETPAELLKALSEPVPWDLVLADYTLPSFGARDALRLIQKQGVDLPFIIVSGTIDEISAVSAMRAGAHDYVLKGHLERLMPAIERELADDSEEPDTDMFEKMLFRTQRRIDEAQERIAHFEQEGNNKKPQLQSDL